jgi:hypothetical protein
MPTMSHRASILTALLVAASLGPVRPAAAQAVQLDLGLSAWEMDVNGTVSAGDAGATGTTIDLPDDLGYDQRERVGALDLVLGQLHQLEVSYLDFEVSAHERIARTLHFADKVYAASTRVSSEIDANLLRVAYRHATVDGALCGGVLLGLQFADVAAELAASGPGRAQESVRTTLPVVGVFGNLDPVPFLSLSASVAGGSWNWSDTSVSYIDAQAMARLNLFPFFLAGGYRYVSFEGDDTGVPLDVDLDFQGPQFAAGLRF